MTQPTRGAVFGKRSRSAGLKLLKLRALEERQRAFGNQMFSKQIPRRWERPFSFVQMPDWQPCRPHCASRAPREGALAQMSASGTFSDIPPAPMNVRYRGIVLQNDSEFSATQF